MSFTSEAKLQICNEDLERIQMKAQLCALFQMRASLHMNWQGMYLSFQSEHAFIVKHIFKLIKEIYKVDPRLSVIKKMQLKKNNIYRIQIYDKASEILEDLKIYTDEGFNFVPPKSFVEDEDIARCYLQGVFLAGGSITDPRTGNYHLDITCNEEEMAEAIKDVMEMFYLPAKTIKRRNHYVVYLKIGEKIADFLRICNASNALFEFEDSRIQRDLLNQIQRLDNIDIANEMKAQKAAAKQLKYIEVIEANASYIKVSEKIRHVMVVRKENPDANNNELCDKIYEKFGEKISKSGMKHRMTKIKELALEFMEDENA
ncbi:MAG: DNA-binding protein WhiA [Bacillota bacterium]|nr:DNA-binding protein WhiA [Bacillota bacterium]